MKRLKIMLISTWFYAVSACCGHSLGAGSVELGPPFPPGHHNTYHHHDENRQLKEMVEHLTEKMPNLVDVKVGFAKSTRNA